MTVSTLKKTGKKQEGKKSKGSRDNGKKMTIAMNHKCHSKNACSTKDWVVIALTFDKKKILYKGKNEIFKKVRKKWFGS